MKRMIWIVLAVLCLPGAVMADERSGGLRIEVISAETQRPLQGVAVTVTDREGNAVEGRTTEDGVLELEGLEPGLYAVTAEGPGLVTATEPSVRIVRRRVTPLGLEMLAAEEAIEEIVVRARARVADPYGPVSNSFFNR